MSIPDAAPPSSEPQLLTLLTTLVNTIQQENVRLRQEMADERLCAQASREKFIDALLSYLPSVMAHLFESKSASPATSSAVFAASLVDLIESISADSLQEILKILSTAQKIRLTQLLSLAREVLAREAPASGSAPS
jgi:hypothetical protein